MNKKIIFLIVCVFLIVPLVQSIDVDYSDQKLYTDEKFYESSDPSKWNYNSENFNWDYALKNKNIYSAKEFYSALPLQYYSKIDYNKVAYDLIPDHSKVNAKKYVQDIAPGRSLYVKFDSNAIYSKDGIALPNGKFVSLAKYPLKTTFRVKEQTIDVILPKNTKSFDIVSTDTVSIDTAGGMVEFNVPSQNSLNKISLSGNIVLDKNKIYLQRRASITSNGIIVSNTGDVPLEIVTNKPEKTMINSLYISDEGLVSVSGKSKVTIPGVKGQFELQKEESFLEINNWVNLNGRVLKDGSIDLTSNKAINRRVNSEINRANTEITNLRERESELNSKSVKTRSEKQELKIIKSRLDKYNSVLNSAGKIELVAEDDVYRSDSVKTLQKILSVERQDIAVDGYYGPITNLYSMDILTDGELIIEPSKTKVTKDNVILQSGNLGVIDEAPITIGQTKRTSNIYEYSDKIAAFLNAHPTLKTQGDVYKYFLTNNPTSPSDARKEAKQNGFDYVDLALNKETPVTSILKNGEIYVSEKTSSALIAKTTEAVKQKTHRFVVTDPSVDLTLIDPRVIQAIDAVGPKPDFCLSQCRMISNAVYGKKYAQLKSASNIVNSQSYSTLELEEPMTGDNYDPSFVQDMGVVEGDLIGIKVKNKNKMTHVVLVIGESDSDYYILSQPKSGNPEITSLSSYLERKKGTVTHFIKDANGIFSSS